MINSVTNGTDGFNYYDIPKDKCMYIYCRVSTKYQDDNGVSLEVQRDRGLEVSKQLGLEPIYKVDKNPLTWLDTMLNAVEHMNFFEGRATEYSKASTKGTWTEAFS